MEILDFFDDPGKLTLDLVLLALCGYAIGELFFWRGYD